jgi:chemotaxis receptor (MCP) glutamine deamidase CheD
LTFIAGNAFTGVAGQLHYVSTDDGVLLEGDLDGNGAADFAIDVHLSGGAHMMSAGSLLL